MSKKVKNKLEFFFLKSKKIKQPNKIEITPNIFSTY